MPLRKKKPRVQKMNRHYRRATTSFYIAVLVLIIIFPIIIYAISNRNASVGNIRNQAAVYVNPSPTLGAPCKSCQIGDLCSYNGIPGREVCNIDGRLVCLAGFCSPIGSKIYSGCPTGCYHTCNQFNTCTNYGTYIPNSACTCPNVSPTPILDPINVENTYCEQFTTVKSCDKHRDRCAWFFCSNRCRTNTVNDCKQVT
jgi:hypothetical protein